MLPVEFLSRALISKLMTALVSTGREAVDREQKGAVGGRYPARVFPPETLRTQRSIFSEQLIRDARWLFTLFMLLFLLLLLKCCSLKSGSYCVSSLLVG